MAAETAFQRFSHDHEDLVLAVHYNFYGTRMVTASSDHRLKVWDRRDDGWALTDTWKAHSAEVTDVRLHDTLEDGEAFWPCAIEPAFN